ncbi:2-dehydro-3-deoxyphosphogluconate aldolase / (4S)-4-hydroxy-2-oxoglutarate aldolase [Actinobaculum suis]|uniref:2-dehydro-3-deoxyphosphogluconate aldolase / (4S)-4-hydroxy-2-oxoglutarate aldolase n=1 Tax=Actinobaculum suis TaxID=1657 RepID=A0A0K9EVJ7_9ACTO|nr:bifunctional 4-hydroxy-2-oxoglutarate aldolase/2-dehydro-3-deoxy-phosphogluconate aldolase [Actinobaculum suis]KMY23911.1 hypothetical protein ACU19_01450 [Actinobaculum suis]MDY5152844.1 bifunctional 4-hydroxy-2-oxoglutarate aldolase/2-dehydro-3-deoxy-phosphogluconate aldolase [Actinobaculum suis]OCA93346.1 hypothetical protein ACU21_00950 [Actinobaculum suis]SDE65728.1 2-dehydro-3-deoxyphosphogluconate aldolase / (4S)-4-hydroxy-2-oxoglutarate aldolase [Actinobaculum suis]
MLIAIIRLRETVVDDAVISAIIDGGITDIEVTLPTPGALEIVERWNSTKSAAIGVGTVRDAKGARLAIDAGARFLVTPTIDEGVLDAADASNVPVYCGAFSPTEIEAAYRHPAVAGVKVFPAQALGGPSYIKAIKDPLPDIPLFPTGGVNAGNAAEYRRLGCAGLGIGGSIVSEALVAEGNLAEITRRAAEIKEVWDSGIAPVC